MPNYSVILDACSLYGFPVADTLLRAAEVPALYRPYWSEEIWHEVLKTMENSGKPRDAIERRDKATRRAFPQAFIDGDAHMRLVACLELPDENDRHVVAAAIVVRAETIVTFNIKDFLAAAVDQYHIEVKSPDEFLCDLFDLQPAQMTRVIRDQARALRRKPQTPEELLGNLSKTVPKFAALVQGRLGRGDDDSPSLAVPPLVPDPGMPPPEKQGYPRSPN